MSVVLIPNQTVAFNYPLNDCDSCDDREYCTPVLEGETVDFQFRQTPCGPNLICDETLRAIGDNLITNGTFTGSAASWTLGAGWAYAANKVTLTTNTGALTQDLTGLITAGRWYYIRYTVSGVTGTPDLRIKLGGTQVGAPITAAGAYTMTGTADNLDNLISFNDNTGTATYSLDDVELYEMSPCWETTGGWTFTETGITHTSGTNDLHQTTPPLTVGFYYRVIFTVEDITAGSVQARCGTAAGAAVTQDGTYTQYLTANGTGFGFLPTTDFNGRITYAQVKQLKSDWTFGVLDLDASVEYTATNVEEYYNDFVTVSINPSDYIGVNSSCFKIIIHDLCSEYSDNLVTNNMFIDGFTDWTNAANWFTSFHSAYVVAAYNATLYHTKYDSFGNPIIRTETKYLYKFDCWGTFPATTDAVIYTGGRTLTTITTSGQKTGTVTVAAPLNSNVFQIGFHGDGISTTTNIYFSNIELYAITDVEIDYYSQCFKRITDAGCTRLIEAYGDNNDMGFDFVNTGFRIKQRVPLVTVNPIYPTTGADYLYSDGERKVVTATLDKNWMLRTDFIPEYTHDALRVMKIMDNFIIDSEDYFTKPEDYTPDYLGGNDYVRLSSVSFLISKKISTLFNNYCD